MPSQMNQVFLNLITNAAQAIDGDGTLTIDRKVVNNAAEISFTDTGCGSADALLHNILHPLCTAKRAAAAPGRARSWPACRPSSPAAT